MPTTRPLFLLNHLVATVAAKLKPKIPDAEPRHTPIPSNKCHFSETDIIINKPDIIKILEFTKPIFTKIISFDTLEVSKLRVFLCLAAKSLGNFFKSLHGFKKTF